MESMALPTRYDAVGMVNVGLTQFQVAKQLKIGQKTLKRWMAPDCGERSWESQGQREEDGHESSGKVCAEMAPVNNEPGVKTQCEAASRLQVGRALLFCLCLQLKPIKLRRRLG